MPREQIRTAYGASMRYLIETASPEPQILLLYPLRSDVQRLLCD